MEYRTDRKTSNYEFVPLLENKEQITEGSEPVYEGKLRLKLHALSPVYIGSGQEILIEKRLCRATLRNGAGIPIITGSSMKGTVRTIAQAVSYSAQKCVGTPSLKQEGSKYELDTPKQPVKCMCMVCSMFGSMGFAGRVSFSDFAASASDTEIINVPKPYSQNILKVKHRYFSGYKPKGIKFYYSGDWRSVSGDLPTECIKAGTDFIGEVVFNGITKHHLELLCFSLGLDGSFPLRAGGNKAGYFGLLNVEVIESTCYASGNYNHPSIQMDKRVKVDWFEPCKLAALYGKDNHNIMGNIRKLREILNRRV